MTDQQEDLKAKSLSLLPSLKTELGTLATGISDKQLLKFLHWKPDVKRAAERFRAHVQWRKDNAWAFDDPHLRISNDETLERLLKSQFVIAPKLSPKDGGRMIIGRLRRNDMKDGRTPTDVCRTIIYLIDRILEDEEAQLNGVVVFHDLNGLSKDNIHPAIPKMLLGGIIGHFPIRIKGIYLLNAPFFFRGIFTVISKIFFPKKLKERTHMISKIEEIYNVVDKEKLLKEHGGDLEFDADGWVDGQLQREKSGDFDSLHSCL